MAKTNNLLLQLTEDEQTLFGDWQKAINGKGEGTTKSNTQILDEFAGKFAGGLPNQYLKKNSDNEFEFGWEMADATPTDGSNNLLTSDGAKKAIDAIDNGKEINITASGNVSISLLPNVFYNLTGELSSLEIAFADEASGRENEYKGQFVSGVTTPEVTFPASVIWVGGELVIQPVKTYQFSVLNNIGVMVGV